MSVICNGNGRLILREDVKSHHYIISFDPRDTTDNGLSVDRAQELGEEESLLDFTSEERCSFELYKSSVCHRVKEMGDIDFIIDTLEQDDIRMYYQRGGIGNVCIYWQCWTISAG